MLRRTMKAPRSFFILLFVLSLAFATGGCGDNTELDEPDGSKNGPPEPQWHDAAPLSESKYGHEVLSYNGKLYAVGGYNSNITLEVYDPAGRVWSGLTDMPTPQELTAGAVVNGKIYMFGSYGWSDIVQVYDISTDTWSSAASIPIGMYWETAEAVGNNVYLIGGFSNATSSHVLYTVYVYDTVNDTWSRGADAPGYMMTPASAVHGTDIYVFYKAYDIYGQLIDAAFKYDTVADTWSYIPAPPDWQGCGSEAVTVGEKIYLIGGNDGYIYEAYTNTSIYDIASQVWDTGPALSEGRYQFGAALLNGRIYAVGGRNAQAEATDSVEFLDVQ